MVEIELHEEQLAEISGGCQGLHLGFGGSLHLGFGGGYFGGVYPVATTVVAPVETTVSVPVAVQTGTVGVVSGGGCPTGVTVSNPCQPGLGLGVVL